MDDQARQSGKRVRTTEAYVPGYVEPIKLRAGEVCVVGHRDQQWKAYLWCSNQRGEAGWVPDTYLRMEGRASAVALRDYDGTELTVAKGEVLDVLDEEGGWLWCRTSLGRLGWIPHDIAEDV